MIAVHTDIRSSIERAHYALVPSHEFSFSPALNISRDQFSKDWEQLEVDPYMADGGTYRSRRYGLFRLSATTGQLTHIPDASFYQSIDINPLNGGASRQFAPLAADTINNPFLHEILRFDIDQMVPENSTRTDWLIGVHQIRINAVFGVAGYPTPEGIHRDDETYTAQHLIARNNIDGGINYFYGSGVEPTKRPQAVLTQRSYFDSYYFDRSIWHSVSPIGIDDHNSEGHRDVLLIDFVESSKVN